MHLLVDALGRGLGSRQAAAEHMTVPGKWMRTMTISGEVPGGGTLPWNPPTEDRVRKWRLQFLPAEWRPDHRVIPETLRRIQGKVMELGARRALEVGQFPEGVEPDLTCPDRRHEVIGDGTWVREFSKAEVIEDPVLGKVKRHSRAKSLDRVRQQQSRQTLTKHDKPVSGVLHTALLTESAVGWIFLGGDQTFGGESHSSLWLVEELTAHLGERVHTLNYDRGYTGWVVNWVMAQYGIALVSTKTPETKPEDDPDLKQHALDAKLALAGLLSADDARRSALAPVRAQRALQKAVNAEQMRKHRKLGLPAGIGHRLGRCNYLTSDDNVETVVSVYHHYKTLTHDGADGTVCAHELYVDDGALWEAVQQGNVWVKAQRPSARARRVRNPDTGGWTRVMDYELTCDETGQVLREQARWEPKLHRGSVENKSGRSSEDKALEAMQPLPRCDVGFGSAYGRRNEVESWFSWYKSKLRRASSAASLSLDHQLFDLLLAGMVTNARALRRARLTGLLAAQPEAA